jgi:hypothetical protein
MRSDIKRKTRAGRPRLFKHRRPLSRQRKFSPVRRSRARGIYPLQYARKASERRRAHVHCSTRRRVVYAWLSSLCASIGEIQRLPRKQRGTSTEFRLSKLHPAITIFVSGTTLAASVHYRGRCWDLLKYFEHRAEDASTGRIGPMCVPEQQTVDDSADARWKTAVFDGFRRWFGITLRAAQALILYSTPDGDTWAELTPFATPRGPHETARFPVWKDSPQAVTL